MDTIGFDGFNWEEVEVEETSSRKRNEDGGRIMDTIYREEAIKEIDDLCDKNKSLIDTWLLYAIEDTLDELPSAEKTGKWIKLDGCDAVQCSECLYDFVYIDGLYYLCHDQELPNYCPNCGAKMED